MWGKMWGEMWGEMWSGMYDNILSLKPVSWTSEAAYPFIQ